MMNTEEIARKRTAAKELVIKMGQAEAIKYCEEMAMQAHQNILSLSNYNSQLIEEFEKQEREWYQMKDFILHNI
jgi:hypothetical protein